MNSWVDLRKQFPFIKGDSIHFIESSFQNMEEKLLELNFTIYKINGENISDEVSFFREVAHTFKFPSYFGHNWAAWNDSLGEFLQSPNQRIAIVWEHASKTFSLDAQTFLQAVCDLNSLVFRNVHGMSKDNSNYKQIEIFIAK